MITRAFIDDNTKLYDITYYHDPARWNKFSIDKDNPISNEENWSKEIKYLNNENNDISDEIKELPTDTGGIYIFYIKGISLTFFENYIVYVGRCQYSTHQNIRKRANEYFKDERNFIKRMFHYWKECLYYRYYPDTNNERIKKNEAILLNAIYPPFNPLIPNNIDVQQTIPAF